jgi:hypothetical protein
MGYEAGKIIDYGNVKAQLNQAPLWVREELIL